MLEKSDIIVYIPVYNDKEALSRNLDKLEAMGLKAFVVDGRFTDFPQINGKDYSTDGTMEMAAVRHHYYMAVEPMREQNKLNLAIEQCHGEHKVFMYIGADAYLEGDIDEFLINLTRQYERFVTGPAILLIHTEETQPDSKWNNTNSRQPRILLNYQSMEARHLHWAMFEKGAPDDQPLETQQILVEGLKIVHDNTIRPKERDDLMTAYQNINVPREREMFMTHIAKKAYNNIKVATQLAGTYPGTRKGFLESDSTHIIFAKDEFIVTDKIIKMFKKAIKARNTVMESVSILSAVYDAGDGKITMDPTGKHLDSLPQNYPAVKKMYSAEGIKPTSPFMVIPWTAGPIICMDRRSVALIDNMGDDLDFMTFTNQLGLQKDAVTDIRL